MSKVDDFLSQIVAESDIEAVYEALISVLDYKHSINFTSRLTECALFDAEYCVSIDNVKYPVLGIKLMNCRDEHIIAKTHLRLWNKNDIPFSIFVLPGEIRIYNNFTVRENKLLYSSQRQANSVELMDFCGSSIIANIVNQRLEKYINKSDRVDQRLLENLRATIQQLYSKHAMDLESAYNFLAQCIFVKYLEDRGIINLESDAFQKVKVKNFTELLATHKANLVAELFKKLKYKFNGDLFDMGDKVCSSSRKCIKRAPKST